MSVVHASRSSHALTCLQPEASGGGTHCSSGRHWALVKQEASQILFVHVSPDRQSAFDAHDLGAQNPPTHGHPNALQGERHTPAHESVVHGSPSSHDFTVLKHWLSWHTSTVHAT